MIRCLQASTEAERKERRRGHVYGKESDPEHLLSNADLPGMVYGWGVGMYVSAPSMIRGRDHAEAIYAREPVNGCRAFHWDRHSRIGRKGRQRSGLGLYR